MQRREARSGYITDTDSLVLYSLMFSYVQIGHEPNCLSPRPLLRRAILVAAGSNQSEIKMATLAACHVDDLDVQRQFVDVFTGYLNEHFERRQ